MTKELLTKLNHDAKVIGEMIDQGISPEEAVKSYAKISGVSEQIAELALYIGNSFAAK